MSDLDLEGQVAVVTGGARGLGFGIAERLAKAGARVAIWDIDPVTLNQAVKALGEGKSIGCITSIENYAAVAKSVSTTEAELGPISILVNSAGVAGTNANLVDYELDEWRRVIDINLTGTFHVNRAVVPGMITRNYGRIVNIASIAGKEGNPTASAYSASKAGVIGLTKSLGKEVAKYDIAVNAITPAVANTPILEQCTPEFIEYMLSKIPRGRFLEISEVASLVHFMVSKENSFTTAAVFDVSGGRATY